MLRDGILVDYYISLSFKDSCFVTHPTHSLIAVVNVRYRCRYMAVHIGPTLYNINSSSRNTGVIGEPYKLLVT